MATSTTSELPHDTALEGNAKASSQAEAQKEIASTQTVKVDVCPAGKHTNCNFLRAQQTLSRALPTLNTTHE
jgi:hypothetical protein